MRHDLDGLIYVIKDDESGSDHEESFRKTRDGVGERSGGLGDGFKVCNRVVRDETDRTAWL